MSGPLEGIRVLEATLWMMGPIAGYILGDLGADVIKIEPPGGGDPLRGNKLVRDGKSLPTDRNSSMEAFNRNKRSIVVDLRKKKGQDIIYKLIKTTDVFLHNYSPGTPEKLGLSYETLSAHNPKLIYAEASGFGPKGPRSLERAFEPLAMGTAGSFYVVGEPDSPPKIWLPGAGDQMGGVMTALTILAALYTRAHQGIGQKVNASILGALIAWQILPLSSLLINGLEYPRKSRLKVGNPLNNHYCCSDGKYLTAYHMQSDLDWHNWCKALGMEKYENDPRFNNIEARVENSETLISIHDKIFSTKPRDEWLKILKENDLIVGPILSLSEAVNDPQVLANDYITTYEDPAYGRTKVVGFPYQFSKTPPSIAKPPPAYGQHTEEVLLETGYSWDDIVRFKDEGVIL